MTPRTKNGAQPGDIGLAPTPESHTTKGPRPMGLTPAQRELRRDHRSRLDAARVLVDLEEQAFHADLPLLDWTVSTGGLIGRPQPTADPNKRQAAFDAWAAHLGAEISEPTARSWPTPGRVLFARARVSHPQASTGTVQVTLTAEIEEDPA